MMTLSKIKYLILIALTTIIVALMSSFIFSETPIKTIYYFFVGGVSNIYSFGNMLNVASCLIIAGLGMCIAFNIGFFNLGGEGQIYVGGFITTILLIELNYLNPFLGIIISVLASILVAGFVASFSGALKVRFNINDLISTYLVSRILILIIDYLIRSPFRNKDSNLITTLEINEKFHLANILSPSRLNTSFFIAIILSILLYIYLYKTKFGYETILLQKNKEFAKYGGIPTRRYIIISSFLSGAFHGLSGSLIVLGTYHSAISGFSLGIGFSAIAVSLIAKNNPILIIPSAIFFAYIEEGAKSASIQSDASIDMALLLQSIIFLIISIKVIPKLVFPKKKLREKNV